MRLAKQYAQQVLKVLVFDGADLSGNSVRVSLKKIITTALFIPLGGQV
jgi:hypothetical protein